MSRIFRHGRQRASIISLSVLILTLDLPALLHGQEHQYNIGPTVDLVTGSDSHPLNNLSYAVPQVSTNASTFFRLYPSVSLATSEGTSSLRASYALALAGTRGDVDYNTLSQSASLTLSREAGPKWKLNLAEAFLTTSDATSFNELRGTSLPPDQFRYLFNAAALRISTRTNTVNIDTQYTLSPRSTLSIAGSHSLLNYNGGAIQNFVLSDQQFVTGTIDYIQKATVRDSWRVGYTAGYVDLQNFRNLLSHNVHVGYSVAMASDVMLDLTVGASQVGSVGSLPSLESRPSLGTAESYVGYSSSISIIKTKLNDTFSARFRQDAGQPTGQGSLSDTRQVGVSVEHRLKTFELFIDASVFDAQGVLGNVYQIRGGTGAASIGIPLTPTLSVIGGYQYQRYQQAGPSGFTQQRLFVTLRYRDPERWKIVR